MSMSDPISDMLIRVQNAARVGKSTVSMCSSKIKIAIAAVLKSEGYITDYQIKDINCIKRELQIVLKYHENRPVIDCFKRVSRPGLRIYKNHTNIPRIMNGLGTVIMSTPCGVITDRMARSKRIGGEVLCYVT